METHPIEILLLDNDPENIRATEAFFAENKIKNSLSIIRETKCTLAFLGYQVNAVSNTLPDLILVNYSLIQQEQRVLDEMKQNPVIRSIPHIILFDSKDLQHAYHQANGDHDLSIVKPLTMRALVDVLRRCKQLGLTIVSEPLVGMMKAMFASV
jgi:two-component system response regulator